MDKKTILIAFSLLIVIILMTNILALTASIGNARMVLRVETGDEIEKYILVKNVNDVRVDIELSASGDLEDYVEIIDDKFSLEPGEEKKAYFTIDVVKPGSTETRINVKFIPEKGNGVGFSSTVIVIASGEDLSEEYKKESESVIEKANEKINLATGKIIDNIKNKDPSNIVVMLLMFAFLLFVLLIILASIKPKRVKETKLKENKKND